MDTIKKSSKHLLALIVAFCLGVVPTQAALPEIHGFGEAAFGLNVGDDAGTKHARYNLLEQRLQLKSTYYVEGENILAQKGTTLNFKGDLLLDEYFAFKATLDLRELNVSLTPLEWMDLKVGRQVLTWGTGDYLFVNDLFPKDYVSFFSGRDDEYLKQPSDAVKISLYPEIFNLDLVTSFFEPNTLPTGDRLSFFDLYQGRIAGRDIERFIVEPARQFRNNEYALRAYRSVGSTELAFYYFRGFDKNTTSIEDEARRRFFYRRIDSYGGSARGAFLGGVANAEFAFYNSRDDSSGKNRLIENSAFKGLVGYEKDLGNDLKLGLQYLYEQRLDYDDYKAALLPGDLKFDQFRHLVTQRITKLFRNQTVQASVFNFYSPSDKDGYVRPSLSYDITDQWKAVMGANIPWGKKDFTEFGRMRKNANVFIRVRYSF